MAVTLTTRRLILRAFRASDLDAYAEICADPQVTRFLGAGTPLSREDTWRQMAMFLGHWDLLGYGMWALEEGASGRLLGRVGFLNPEGWPGFELGWALGRAHWNRGFATEAAHAALYHAFTELARTHVISLIYPENTASIRVAEKLGESFEREMDIFGKRVLVYGIYRPEQRA